MINLLSVAALLLSLFGNLLINNRCRAGFVVWFLSNIAWIAVNLLSTPNWSQIAMFATYMCFNAQGWWNWGRRK